MLQESLTITMELELNGAVNMDKVIDSDSDHPSKNSLVLEDDSLQVCLACDLAFAR